MTEENEPNADEKQMKLMLVAAGLIKPPQWSTLTDAEKDTAWDELHRVLALTTIKLREAFASINELDKLVGDEPKPAGPQKDPVPPLGAVDPQAAADAHDVRLWDERHKGI
jgi:hypothetical protein